MTWQNTRTLPRGGARKTALKVDNGWIQTANESGKRFDTFTTLLVCFLPSFIRSLACSHKGYTNDSNSISKSGSSDNKTAQKVQSVLTVQVECPSMLARSVGRSIGRLVSFHFLSLRAHSTAQHGTARHAQPANTNEQDFRHNRADRPWTKTASKVTHRPETHLVSFLQSLQCTSTQGEGSFFALHSG